MDNNTNIGDYDLFLDQINDTAENIDYTSTLEHCNQTVEISKKSYMVIWSYATLPMLIASLILGQLIRYVKHGIGAKESIFLSSIYFYQKGGGSVSVITFLKKYILQDFE